MPTSKQDSDFAEEMSQSVDQVRMSGSTLDSAIAWISLKLDPDDVFSQKQLEAWAESNGYVKE